MVKEEAVVKPAVELNAEFKQALAMMEETDRHVFVTGRAGTGKSTLLGYFRKHTQKKIVVLAPTGVAAVNVGGQTIHSFFRFKPDITPAAVQRPKKDEKKNIYKKLKTIVIDEVSMVRADLLDCVDRFLRLNGPDASQPFGGVQMIFIGDLYQLPPVVTGEQKQIFRSHYATPFFFSAQALDGLEMEFIELQKIYRQKDDEFIRLLNAIRNRRVSDADLSVLNGRCFPDFTEPPDDFYIHLTSTNDLADAVNEAQLARLPGRARRFRGVIEGEFGREYLPTSPELRIKKGAQIMLLNNDAFGRWINGTIGRVCGFKKNKEWGDVVHAVLDTGEEVEIVPYTWEIYRFFLKEGELSSEVVGSFTQFPLRLAFAVTIHKSQGKTFEKAVIDIGRGTFAHGQMYVALSRCTTLGGIVLKRPLRKQDILMDWQVVKYLTGYQYRQSARKLPQEEKLRRLEAAIRDKHNVEIVYLTADDEKSSRTIRPLAVGEREYKGYPFVGLEAFCLVRREARVFNVDKILEITMPASMIMNTD